MKLIPGESIKPGTQVLLDAADVLAEDRSTPAAFRILRTLLSAVSRTASPAGRLILPLPASTPFTADVLSASLSPSLAVLTPLPPSVVEATATAYMLPADDDRFYPLLETASLRGAGDTPVLRGDSPTPDSSAAVQVLLRKAAGGAKGIVRTVEGLRRQGRVGKPDGDRWDVAPLAQVVDVRPTVAAATKVTTHADLNLPFNLSLTDQQREARGAVPLPYAHEGEGADLSMGMDWSDDEEDEEI